MIEYEQVGFKSSGSPTPCFRNLSIASCACPQDWLITVFRGVDAAQSNITAADMWLGAMNEAAQNLGLTIQYCMATPRFILKSTQMLSVTNARASPDYHPGGNFDSNSDYPPNWAVGFPSMLHFAMGVYPSKVRACRDLMNR